MPLKLTERRPLSKRVKVFVVISTPSYGLEPLKKYIRNLIGRNTTAAPGPLSGEIANSLL